MAIKYHCPKCGKRYVEWGAEKLGFRCPDCQDEELIRVGASPDKLGQTPSLRRRAQGAPSVGSHKQGGAIAGLAQADEVVKPLDSARMPIAADDLDVAEIGGEEAVEKPDELDFNEGSNTLGETALEPSNDDLQTLSD